MKSTLLALACLAAGTSARFPESNGFHRFAPRQTGIAWQPCFNKNTQCGYFDVPMDYKNPAAGKASLAVIRYLATQTPKLGTIFANPGGPGGSGVSFIAGGSGKQISFTSGGQYDIVSWDPRGVNNTKPRIDCFPTNPEESAFWIGTIPGGLEARGNFTEKADLDYFYSQVDSVDAKLRELDAKCMQLNGDALKYVGSVAAVRDLVSLADYLEGPGKPIHYWGFSYGTVIGSYFVNMYPDRVGRVILDGVVNPHVWGALPPHLTWGDWIQSSDEALEGFALACATAGPAGCALALTPTTTPPDILKWILALIDKAYDYNRAGYQAGYSSSYIRGYILQGLYQPLGWVNMAAALLEMDDEITYALSGPGATKPVKRVANRPVNDLQHRAASLLQIRQAAANQDNSYQAVMCADAIDQSGVTTKDVFDELVRVSRQVSPTFGPRWGIFRLSCHRWTPRAVERYTGPWNKVLANPILVIGNEADPITPYVSAKFIADQLGDSAILVQQDDYGHCSLAMHSDCTAGIIGNYFMKGVLPTADQFCGTNQVLFPGAGITKASLKTSSVKSTDGGSGGDSFGDKIQEKFDEFTKDKKTLLIVAIALGASAIVLVLALIAQAHFYRRKSKGQAYSKVALHEGAGPSHGHGSSKSFDKESTYKGSYSDHHEAERLHS